MSDYTHICSGCSAEFASKSNLPPPEWHWAGSKLHCPDCTRQFAQASLKPIAPRAAIPGTDSDCVAAPVLPKIESYAGQDFSGTFLQSSLWNGFGVCAVHKNREWQIGVIIDGKLSVMTMVQFRKIAAEGTTLLQAMEQNWELQSTDAVEGSHPVQAEPQLHPAA